MKTETVVLQSWDDLVFENRNKAYGAYFVRKSYSDNVVRAFVVIMVASAVVLILPSLTFVDSNNVHSIGELLKQTVIETHPPRVIQIEPEKKLSQRVKSVNKNLIPVVTDKEVIDDPVPPADEFTSSGTETGTETVSMPDVGTVSTTSIPVEAPKVFTAVEEMPQYIGGTEAMMKFLQKQLRYPATPRRLGVQGTVFVSFIINTNGEVIGTQVIKGISKECDEEAVRVISLMPLWNPGKQNHIPVMVRMVLPIKFKLSND